MVGLSVSSWVEESFFSISNLHVAACSNQSGSVPDPGVSRSFLSVARSVFISTLDRLLRVDEKKVMLDLVDFVWSIKQPNGHPFLFYPGIKVHLMCFDGAVVKVYVKHIG